MARHHCDQPAPSEKWNLVPPRKNPGHAPASQGYKWDETIINISRYRMFGKDISDDSPLEKSNFLYFGTAFIVLNSIYNDLIENSWISNDAFFPFSLSIDRRLFWLGLETHFWEAWKLKRPMFELMWIFRDEQRFRASDFFLLDWTCCFSPAFSWRFNKPTAERVHVMLLLKRSR